MNSRNHLLTKIHLLISVMIVVPTAIIYGFQLDSLLKFQLDTLDELNQFKAMMGLYLGFSALWIVGMFKTEFLKTAVITNMIFMLGLGFGRILSIWLDGTPSLAYIFGALGEFVLGFYSLWVLISKKL
jgi:hypothetical protein